MGALFEMAEGVVGGWESREREEGGCDQSGESE